MRSNPNVLFILTDQHRAISTGCYGSSEVNTPNIDALAGQSARFSAAYCQYPICTASRQSILTGEYPGRNGTYQNYLASIDPLQWTFPGAFTRAGYESVLIGKGHCNQNGFLKRLESEEYARQYWPKDVLNAIRPPHFGREYRLNAQTAGLWPFEEKYLQSYFVEQQAIRFLRNRRSGPFLAYLSFDFPHPPFLVPQRYWDAIDPEELTLPPQGADQGIHPYWGETLLGESMLRNYLRGYYACLACVDESIGRILDCAQSEGLFENTIIIYTSDHGESGGHHGKYEKHSFYDTDIRVPLLIRMPDSKPTVVQDVVELIDLVPTLLDYCGVDSDGANLDGASLRGLLEGVSDGWKNRAFCENYWPRRKERNGDVVEENYGRALIEDGFKCCIGGNMLQPYSLFDLNEDPHELQNLWACADYASTRDRMLQAIQADWCRVANPQASYDELRWVNGS